MAMESWVVYHQQMCAEEREDTIEDELHIRVLLLQEDAWRRLRGMCWCKKELPVCWMAMESWVVYHQQMCAEETEDTIEDELHTRVLLLRKTKVTSKLPSYMLRVWGSSLKFAFVY